MLRLIYRVREIVVTPCEFKYLKIRTFYKIQGLERFIVLATWLYYTRYILHEGLRLSHLYKCVNVRIINI